jgi:hypothetical protein
MARNRFRRRPELEALETMVLLSAGPGAEGAGTAAMTDAVLNMSGTAEGTYKTARSGEPTTFSEQGDVSPLGKVKIKGSIDYLLATPAGTVTISSAKGKRGTITASVVTGGPYSPIYYTITGATGVYAGDTGSGVAVLSSVPAKGKGPAHGKVVVDFYAAD